LVSSVIDNVPLVAAAQGMYDLTHILQTTISGISGILYWNWWQCPDNWLCRWCGCYEYAKINFFWYLKKIRWLALIGFFPELVSISCKIL